MTSFCGWQSVVEILRICCDETCSYLFYGSHKSPVLNFFRARKKVKKATQGDSLMLWHITGKPRQSPSADQMQLGHQTFISGVLKNLPRLLPASLCSNRTDPNDFDGARPGLYFQAATQTVPPAQNVRRGCQKGYLLHTYIHNLQIFASFVRLYITTKTKLHVPGKLVMLQKMDFYYRNIGHLNLASG